MLLWLLLWRPSDQNDAIVAGIVAWCWVATIVAGCWVAAIVAGCWVPIVAGSLLWLGPWVWVPFFSLSSLSFHHTFVLNYVI